MCAVSLERPAMNIVNVSRPIQADRNGNVMCLEAIQPSVVDQHAVGRDRDRYLTSRSPRHRFASLGKAMEILDAPQQRLAAMQDDGEINKGVRGDVFLDTRQQLTQHVGAHQLWLVVDGCVAEPVAIGAIDVAARGDLHEQLRDRPIMEGDGTSIISRHASTDRVGGTFTSACQ